MPTQSELRVLQAGQQRVARMARAELEGWWALLDKSDPMRVREELMEFFPVLVAEYGNLAGVVAGDWYEEIYQEASQLAPLSNEEQARARARWAVGDVFRDEADASLGLLSIITDEMVRQVGRDTVMGSARSNRRMFARVPAGSDTCAWCLMLGSRGFAYHSAQDAGQMAKFHGDCDCEIVPSDGVVPGGYDVDSLYEKYSSVHSPKDSDKAVAAKLREKYGLR